MRHLGDDTRQRRLSAAGRSMENHRGQAIRLNRATQKFARPKNVFLADKLIERARSHPSGQRRSGVCSFSLVCSLEQVLHATNYGALTDCASSFQIEAKDSFMVACKAKSILME